MDRHSRVLAGGCLAVMLGFVVTGRAAAACGTMFRPASPIRQRGAALRRSGLTRILIPTRRLGGGMYGGGLTPGAACPTAVRRARVACHNSERRLQVRDSMRTDYEHVWSTSGLRHHHRSIGNHDVDDPAPTTGWRDRGRVTV